MTHKLVVDKPTQKILYRSVVDQSPQPMPELDPDEFIGRTVLHPPQQNGERLRPKLQRKL